MEGIEYRTYFPWNDKMPLREACNDKLKAARFHLDAMEHLYIGKPPAFRFSLSAFLTAIRSPLQYIYSDAVPSSRRPPPDPPIPTNGPMLAWYEAKMRQSEVLRFFKLERDREIHERPTKPQARVSLSYPLNFVYKGLPFTPAWTRPDRETGEPTFLTIGIRKYYPAPEKYVRWQYNFVDQTNSGTQDVVQLCKRAIIEVENIIAEGIDLGYM